MEKPIVREILMAMCESVATTCCYSVTGTAPLSFAATLHGGKLKCEYVYAYYAKGSDAPLGDGWLDWTGGHVNGEFAANCLPVRENGTWRILMRSTNETLTLEQAKALEILDNIGYCPHEQSNCRYGRSVTDTKTTHVGATSPHSAYVQNNSFLADHIAYQYSS